MKLFRVSVLSAIGIMSVCTAVFGATPPNTTVIVLLNSIYKDAGATAYDNYDGDLTSKIVTTSNVNTAVVGAYTVTYTVADSSGNPNSSTRIVNVVKDTTPPTTIGNPIAVSGTIGTSPIKIYYGTITDNLSGLATVKLYVRIMGATTWTNTNLSATASSGVFTYTPTGAFANKKLEFSIRAQDKAGNWTGYIVEKPTGWFSYPDQNFDLQVYIKLPFCRNLYEYLIKPNSLTADSQIKQIGVGGPNGWGLNSTDLVSFLDLPVGNLWTNLDNANGFRGNPFVVSATNQVSYLNLGPNTNPNWIFWFGANNNLIKPDGSGGNIIDFNLTDYIASPLPEISFTTGANGLRVNINSNVQPADLPRLFYNLVDGTQIDGIGLLHYYLTGGAPWSDYEEVAFFGWPTQFEVKAYQGQTVRFVLVALYQGKIYFANTGFWTATIDNSPVSITDGAWQFNLP